MSETVPGRLGIPCFIPSTLNPHPLRVSDVRLSGEGGEHRNQGSFWGGGGGGCWWC